MEKSLQSQREREVLQVIKAKIKNKEGKVETKRMQISGGLNL